MSSGSNHPRPSPSTIELPHSAEVAYFSMEIALEPQIPTYSGGLGILAGDTIRSAADLEVPMAAVTLLHRQGCFRKAWTPAGTKSNTTIRGTPATAWNASTLRLMWRSRVGQFELVSGAISAGARQVIRFLSTSSTPLWRATVRRTRLSLGTSMEVMLDIAFARKRSSESVESPSWRAWDTPISESST